MGGWACSGSRWEFGVGPEWITRREQAKDVANEIYVAFYAFVLGNLGTQPADGVGRDGAGG